MRLFGGCRHGLIAALQYVSIMQDAFVNCFSDRLAIIRITELFHILLVRNKSRFNQNSRMAHVSQNEKLLSLGPAIKSMRVGDQRILNETSKALAFEV